LLADAEVEHAGRRVGSNFAVVVGSVVAQAVVAGSPIVLGGRALRSRALGGDGG
jgi:hypothetical protein